MGDGKEDCSDGSDEKVGLSMFIILILPFPGLNFKTPSLTTNSVNALNGTQTDANEIATITKHLHKILVLDILNQALFPGMRLLVVLGLRGGVVWRRDLHQQRCSPLSPPSS